jgi:hypothetical protein
MKRSYEKSSQPVTSVKPTTLNLQTRGFAPIQSDSSQVNEQPENSLSESNKSSSNNLLEKLTSTSSSSTPPNNPIQRKLQYRFPVQAKMNIGEPNDKYEKEADATASQVVQQINSPTQEQSVQREAAMEEEEELQMKSLVQRRENIGGGEASTDLESSIQSARGGGQSLDANLQQSMGQAMGADFSSVKVHTDSKSDQLNKSIQAKAFTTGQDLFFRQGAYEPSSRGGQELIAHELTHVVQQGAAAPLQRKFNYTLPKLQSKNDQNVARKIAHSNKLRPQRAWEAQLETTTNSATAGNLQLKPRGLSGELLSPEVSPVRANLQTKHNGLQAKSLQEQPESLANQQVAKFNTSNSSIQAKSLVSKQSSDVIQKVGYFEEGGTNDKISKGLDADDKASTGKKVGVAVGTGLLNAFAAPINPVFWAQWIKDHQELQNLTDADKKVKYGEGKLGTAMQVLDGIALSCQNVGTIAGVVATITGIAGTALAAVGGAGAPLLAASAIATIIGLSMSTAVAVLKLILVANNARRLSQYAEGSAERAQLKAKLWSDAGAAFGALLGVASGGLGVGAVAMGGGATAMGQTMAATAGGQAFGTAGDIAGTITDAKKDENEEEAKKIENEEEAKKIAAQVKTIAVTDQANAKTEVAKVTDASNAIEGTKSEVETKLLPDVNKSAQDSEKIKQDVTTAEGGAASDTKGKEGAESESKLKKADQELSKAEQKLGIPKTEEPKKGLFSRFKDWVKSGFSSVYKRIQKVVASVKAKVMNMVLEMVGAKAPIEEVKNQLIATKAQVPGSIKAEQAVSQQAAATAGLADEVKAKA